MRRWAPGPDRPQRRTTFAARETGEIAEQLIADAITRHGRPRSLHADCGTSMTSKPVAQLLVDLGVDRPHSRPHVSNDNPCSDAEPVGEDRGLLHRRPRLLRPVLRRRQPLPPPLRDRLAHPASVHHCTAPTTRARRAVTLEAADQANPNRFSRPPQPSRLPDVAWIIEPSLKALRQTASPLSQRP